MTRTDVECQPLLRAGSIDEAECQVFSLTSAQRADGTDLPPGAAVRRRPRLASSLFSHSTMYVFSNNLALALPLLSSGRLRGLESQGRQLKPLQRSSTAEFWFYLPFHIYTPAKRDFSPVLFWGFTTLGVFARGVLSALNVNPYHRSSDIKVPYDSYLHPCLKLS